MDNKISTIKSQLTDFYNHRIEMHAHTAPVSPCGEASPKELIQIYSKLNYDAICITNHFISYIFKENALFSGMTKEEKIDRYIADFEDAKTEGEKYGITVILGAELRFADSDNDFLLYGVNREILLDIYDYLDCSFEDFRKNYPLANSTIIQAHPFRSPCSPASPELLDGVEVYNTHINHNQVTAKSAAFAAKNNIGIVTCGSDFHHIGIGNEGTSALRAHTLPKNSFELSELLKSKDFILDIAEKDIIL